MRKHFNGDIVCLELSSSVKYKEKKSLIEAVIRHGGQVSFILNKKVSYLIRDDIANLDTYKCRTAAKLGIPILHSKYIDELSSRDDAAQLKKSDYLILTKKPDDILKKGVIPAKTNKTRVGSGGGSTGSKSRTIDLSKVEFFHFGESDPFSQDFESGGASYDVLKWIVVNEKTGVHSNLFEIDARTSPLSAGMKFRLRIEKFSRAKEAESSVKCAYSNSGLYILDLYKACLKAFLNDKLFEFSRELSNPRIGSKLFQSTVLKSKIESAGSVVDRETVDLVNIVWKEAVGDLEEMIDLNPKDILKRLSLETINKAECVLEKQRQAMAKGDASADFTWEFYALMPLKKKYQTSIKNKRTLYERFELCQLVRDIVSVNEETNWETRTSVQSRYRSIGAHVNSLAHQSDQFQDVQKRILDEYPDKTQRPKVLNVFEVTRPSENLNYATHLSNQQQLYHGSKANNFLGILSRGLQLPKYVLDEHGIIENRTDVGLLGAGIYFSSSAQTSLKYSNKANCKNTRFLLICDVALGKVKKYFDHDYNLTRAPDGYHSVHGVKRDDVNESKFADDEFVVYDTKQNRLRYLVELSFDAADGQVNKALVESMFAETSALSGQFKDAKSIAAKIEDLSIEKLEKSREVLNKSDDEKATSLECGLVSEKSGKNLPLISIHVRAQLVDILSKVIIFQEYANEDDEPIEAKFLFPLSDTAAVCGFEAFINDKHVVGICKEKEQAHREYREAIQRGDGAYLMDQETQELFKVNVGNLPPKSRCIIKITYVAELDIENEQIVFQLPTNIAPWQAMKYESEKLQDTLLSKLISNIQLSSGVKSDSGPKSSFQASILMPFEIKSIKCPTHILNIKKTACQAVVELDRSDASSNHLDKTLVVNISIATIHMPRMLVEDYEASSARPDQLAEGGLNTELLGKRACMVSFYPEFETKVNKCPNIYFLLDSSNSMAFDGSDSFVHARKLLLLMLKRLPPTCEFNVVAFGTDYAELFPYALKNSSANLAKASDFVQNSCSKATKGNTNLLNILKPFVLAQGSSTTAARRISTEGDSDFFDDDAEMEVDKTDEEEDNEDETINNFVLISDGHLNNENELVQLFNQATAAKARPNRNRLFTCSVGDASNNYLLKLLANKSGGSYEKFDTKYQSKWKSKVDDIMDRVCQPDAIKNISVTWQNENALNKVFKAPSKITALFNGRRVVAYGFIDNCLQATLNAEINNGEKLDTVVTCPELCVTRGDIIHKLTAKALIDDWQYGLLDDADKIKNQLQQTQMKEKVIELSRLFCITSQYTSFLAVEERSEAEKAAAKSRPLASTTPAISELLAADKDSSQIDILPYMSFPSSSGQSQLQKSDDAESGFSDNIDKLISHLDGDESADNETIDQVLDSLEEVIGQGFGPNHPARLKYNLLRVRTKRALGNDEDARRLGMECFDDAIAELDCLSEDTYKQSTTLLQELRDELTIAALDSYDSDSESVEGSFREYDLANSGSLREPAWMQYELSNEFCIQLEEDEVEEEIRNIEQQARIRSGGRREMERSRSREQVDPEAAYANYKEIMRREKMPTNILDRTVVKPSQLIQEQTQQQQQQQQQRREMILVDQTYQKAQDIAMKMPMSMPALAMPKKMYLRDYEPKATSLRADSSGISFGSAEIPAPMMTASSKAQFSFGARPVASSSSGFGGGPAPAPSSLSSLLSSSAISSSPSNLDGFSFGASKAASSSTDFGGSTGFSFGASTTTTSSSSIGFGGVPGAKASMPVQQKLMAPISNNFAGTGAWQPQFNAVQANAGGLFGSMATGNLQPAPPMVPPGFAMPGSSIFSSSSQVPVNAPMPPPPPPPPAQAQMFYPTMAAMAPAASYYFPSVASSSAAPSYSPSSPSYSPTSPNHSSIESSMRYSVESKRSSARGRGAVSSLRYHSDARSAPRFATQRFGSSDIDKRERDSSSLSDNVNNLRSQLQSLDAMVNQNIEQVLQRGDRLEDLAVNSGALELQSAVFMKKAKSAKSSRWSAPTESLKKKISFDDQSLECDDIGGEAVQLDLEEPDDGTLDHIIKYKIQRKLRGRLDSFKNAGFYSLVRDIYKKAQRDDAYEFNTSSIRSLLGVDLEPVVQFLDKCGVKSFGEAAETELKQMMLALFMSYMCLYIMCKCQNKRLNDLGLESLSNLRGWFMAYENAEIGRMPNDLKLFLTHGVSFVEKVQKKHSLACFNLELAKNWDAFLKDRLLQE